MSNNSWNQTIITAQGAGSALTAAAAASMLPGQAKQTFPANQLKIGDSFSIRAAGIISCVVTTPGTARYDVRFGAVVVYDTGAMNLNIVAKTSVPWWLDIELVVRSVGSGTSATLWGQGTWASEAVIASPANSVGGNGLLNVPVSSLAVSTGFDSTTSFVIDSFFTQTVATGSMTCEMFRVTYNT